jgi:uncharacterized protein (UPF0248 family)
MVKRYSLLRDILNRIKWDNSYPHEEFQVTYTHRGVIGDQLTINFIDISEIRSSWIIISNNNEDTPIPFHRIISVKNFVTSETLYEKRRRLND